MARIPNNELDRIKRNISLLRLIESQGYEIKRQGKDYVTRCPFHGDCKYFCVTASFKCSRPNGLQIRS